MERKTGSSQVCQRDVKPKSLQREDAGMKFEGCLAHSGPGVVAAKHFHSWSAREYLPPRAFEEPDKPRVAQVAIRVAVIGIDRQLYRLDRAQNVAFPGANRQERVVTESLQLAGSPTFQCYRRSIIATLSIYYCPFRAS